MLWAQAAVLHRWHVPEGHVPRYEATFDAHTDWVNDVVMVDQFLATGSSDRTVKLWNPTSAGIVELALYLVVFQCLDASCHCFFVCKHCHSCRQTHVKLATCKHLSFL